MGKEHYPGSRFDSLSLLSGGQVLAGYKAGTIGSPMGAQLRDSGDLRLIREISEAAPPFAVAPGGHCMLALDGYVDGAPASTRLVHLDSGEVLERFPLRPPFIWVDEARFIAQLPDVGSKTSWSGGSPGRGDLIIEKNVLRVDPRIASRHPYLGPLCGSEDVLLVLVDWKRGAARVVAERELKRSLLGLGQLIRNADGTTVYYRDREEVGAIDMTSLRIRWRQRMGINTKTNVFAMYALALSHDEKLLAAGGIAGTAAQGQSLATVATDTGRIVYQSPFTQTVARLGIKPVGHTSVQALAWHPAGWLAVGTAAGIVAHVHMNGHMRVYLGAGKEIRAIVFVNDDRSLRVAGSEKHFRRWELLSDETAA